MGSLDASVGEMLRLLGRRSKHNYIQIGVSSRCTHSCAMCPRTVFGDRWTSADMTLETYGRIAENFSDVSNVYLSGWGEPLLNPHFPEMVRLAKEAGCTVGFTTNGARLDDETMGQIIDDRVDLVSLSLAGATAPTHFNQAQLLVTNNDYSTTYIDKFIPVEYHYSEHMVYNIVTIPEPPALLDFGENVDVTFHYKTKHRDPIYIYAEPYFRGSLVGDFGSSGSPAYAPPGGTGGIVFRIESFSPILEADQIRFSIWDNTFTLLDECFVAMSFLWGPTGQVSQVPGALPAAAVRLDQNFPNPFNPTTSIPVVLTGTRHVRLAVYDLRGRLVRVLADEIMGTGRHEIPFDGSGLASGAYYYRLEGGGPVQTRSMMLVK